MTWHALASLWNYYLQKIIQQHIQTTVMKKLLTTSAFVIAVISSALASGNNNTNFKGSYSFKKAFPKAENVSVKTVGEYTKISFINDNKNMEVFYSPEGDLMAQSKSIGLNELPKGSVESVNKQYGDWSITEAIEFSNENDGSMHYYIGLQSGSKKRIVEADKDGSISIYKN